MTILVEKAVSMSPVGKVARDVYPFSACAPGDSFLVPFGSEDPEVVGMRVRKAAMAYEERAGVSFASAVVKAPDGIRVWCVGQA